MMAWQRKCVFCTYMCLCVHLHAHACACVRARMLRACLVGCDFDPATNMEPKKKTHLATGQLLIFIDIWLVPLLLLLVVCYVSCAVTYTYVHVCACVFVCVYVCLERACMCACVENVCSQG